MSAVPCRAALRPEPFGPRPGPCRRKAGRLIGPNLSAAAAFSRRTQESSWENPTIRQAARLRGRSPLMSAVPCRAALRPEPFGPTTASTGRRRRV
jgi:hypothetical protein